MKDTKFRILLDIHEVHSQATIPVKVGDVSCKIYITLVEGGKPYKIHENSFGVFTGKKGDDNYIFNNCIVENGIIRYDFTPQTVAAAGVLECEVRIYDEDGGVLTTPSFTIVVDERAVKDSDLASSNEFSFLDGILVNEGQRIQNEKNRNAAFNNFGIDLEDDGEVISIVKTDIDGSQEKASFLKYADVIPPVTATATGKAITINPANAPLQQLKLKGETTQEVASNTNVLPYPFTTSTQTVKGVTFTDNGDGSITISGTNSSGNANVTITSNAKLNNVVVGTKYRIQSGATLDSSLTYQVRVVTPNSTQNLIDGDEFEADSTDVTVSIVFQIIVGTTYDLTITPKIVVAECDLISVGDSGSFDVMIYGGENLFDGVVYRENGMYEETTGIWIVRTDLDTYRISVLPNTKYVKLGDWNGIHVFFDKNMNYLAGSNTPPGSFFTAPNNSAYYFCTISKNVDKSNIEFKQAQTLTMPYTLRSVGEVKDEVDFTKGSRTENTYKKVFTGAESFNLRTDTSGGGYYFEYYDHLIKAPTSDYDQNTVCNRLPVIPALWNKNETGYMIASDKSIRLRIDGCTTVAELQAKLKEWYDGGNPLTIITERATPIETPLSETELNAYRHLVTNKGNTTILSEADMEVDYYINKPNAQAIGNIHTQVNKDYFKLQQAIIETGGN